MSRVNSTPIFDAEGKLSFLVVIHHNVTELIERQQQIESHVLQLQNQNRLLNRQTKLLDLSHEAVFAWHLDGEIVYWNQGAEEMYGFSSDVAVGKNPQQLLGSRFPADYGQVRAALVEDKFWSGNIEHTMKNGRQLIIETRMQLIPDEFGASLVLETNRDVTERIRTENEIRKKHHRAEQHYQQYGRLYLVRGCRL